MPQPDAPPPEPGPRSPGASRSQVLLVLLSRLPRIVVLLAVVAVVVAGLALPGAGGALLLVLIGGALAWLLQMAWPVLSPQARGLRVATIVLLLAYAGYKAR